MTSRPYPLLADANWLRGQYVDQRRTAASIAEGLGCSKPTVFDWLSRHGIDRRIAARQLNPFLADVEWLRREYIENGRSLKDIGRELDCTAMTVSNALDRHHIQRRSRGSGTHPSVKRTHGQWVGGKRSRTFQTWASMLERCARPAHKSFADYGGRGIRVCERWLVFENFLADMGERPEEKTLDRIDNDENYEPGNCRWATPLEQRHNRRV